MDKPKVTPKDFFLWVGAMVALYWSVIAFIFLVFNYINYSYPNSLSSLPPNPYDSGVGGEMAAIIVMFPIYVVLMWFIRWDIYRDRSRADIWVRRWALILTLFVAGATIAGDLITLLATFFGGNELTTGFLLKSLLLLLVGAAAFMHFIADYWGYWDRFEGRKRTVCTSVGVLAAIAIVGGFVMFGSPSQARHYRYDEQRVQDLQNIQSQIISYWQAKGALPAKLSDLNDSLSGWTAPMDPIRGQSYTYKRYSPLDFGLCATFDTTGDTRSIPASVAPRGVSGPSGAAVDNWSHGAGEVCFDRSIDPQLYPTSAKK